MTVPLNEPTAVTVTVVAAPVAPELKFTGPVAPIAKSETETEVTVAPNLSDLDEVPTAPLAVIV